ncbi:MAG: anthranilate synthase component I family protein [Leptospirales bacterium]|nr:anthranilate synthase component I family protein [Leptospirales bacterium]
MDFARPAARRIDPAQAALPPLDLPKKPTYLRLAESADFYGLFLTIERRNDCCFLLESAGENGGDARYSVMGFDPLYHFEARTGELRWRRRDGVAGHTRTENPYRTLASWTPQNIIARLYAGGLVGYLGYEASMFFEPALKLQEHPDFPPLEFGLYLDGLILDKMTGELYYFHFGEDRSGQVREWLRCQNTGPEKLNARRIGFSRSPEQHAAMVKGARQEIIAGNTFQCQIGFQEDYEIEGDVIAFYDALRQVSPSPYLFYMKFGGRRLIGASPELVFQLRQGEMETYPLAGTTRRGVTTDEDLRLARALLNDPKEIAEHNMLVDLHRNDLGRVARFGTVKVRRLMDARKFSHVQHISSEVVGIIRKDIDMFDGLASVFPAGTLSGAPKIESMRIIDRLEQSPRGPYGGAVGHFGLNGDCIFAIPIRTLFVSDNRAFARASGGIVYDSQIDAEYQELMNKLAAVRKTMQRFTAEPMS